MLKKELDVFLSSDQKEFAKLRNALAKIICNIPFLACTSLENRGADPTDVVEASIKAVEKSDLYVGIFGRQYSQTTIQEYLKAVECKLPCFTYVKTARQRDPQLSEFINDVLKNQFHFFEFHHSADVESQLDSDLRRFILETIILGLEERTKKKGQATALISKEKKAAQQAIKKRDPLTAAKEAFQQNRFLECTLIASAIIETKLRNYLRERGAPNSSIQSLEQEISSITQLEVLTPDQINTLRRVSILRNNAVHMGYEVDKNTARCILDLSLGFIETLASLKPSLLNALVSVQVNDSTGKLYFTNIIFANSQTGAFSTMFRLPLLVHNGKWSIIATAARDGHLIQKATNYFSIGDPATPNVTSLDENRNPFGYSLTVDCDKDIYKPGDLVTIFGKLTKIERKY